MLSRTRRLALLLFLFISFCLAAQRSTGTQATQKPKPRHPVQLDGASILARDPSTGEMRVIERADTPAADSVDLPSAATVRVDVNLVPVTCNVFDKDGNSVTGLKAENFKIFEDGANQPLAYFDAATQPASVAMVVDASPSVLPDSSAVLNSAESLARILSTRDEIAVVAFSAHSYELLPFSNDRPALQETIQKIDVRALFGDVGGSNIYETIFLVAEKLFRARAGRKAILLFTDGQDSGMGLRLNSSPSNRATRSATAIPATQPSPPPPNQPNAAIPNRLTFDDVVRALSKNGIEVYIVSTQNRPRVLTESWMATHASDSLLTETARAAGIPAYTLFLAELVRQAGGELYFLPAMAGQRGFERIASNIHTQYSLGFYPETESAVRTGWHQLRVTITNAAGVTSESVIVKNRPSFYVSPK